MTWQAWFPKAVGHAIDAGHFLVEEKPVQVLKSLEMHLSGIDTLPA
jgi:haloacetate dehalogenase